MSTRFSHRQLVGLTTTVMLACAACLSLIAVAPRYCAAAEDQLFAPSNLVAWCIVPFDAKKRGPEERAQMLDRLGLKRLAYDWRDEHIPTFDQEVETMQRHGIEIPRGGSPAA